MERDTAREEGREGEREGGEGGRNYFGCVLPERMLTGGRPAAVWGGPKGLPVPPRLAGRSIPEYRGAGKGGEGEGGGKGKKGDAWLGLNCRGPSGI